MTAMQTMMMTRMTGMRMINLLTYFPRRLYNTTCDEITKNWWWYCYISTGSQWLPYFVDLLWQILFLYVTRCSVPPHDVSPFPRMDRQNNLLCDSFFPGCVRKPISLSWCYPLLARVHTITYLVLRTCRIYYSLRLIVIIIHQTINQIWLYISNWCYLILILPWCIHHSRIIRVEYM